MKIWQWFKNDKCEIEAWISLDTFTKAIHVKKGLGDSQGAMQQ